MKFNLVKTYKIFLVAVWVLAFLFFLLKAIAPSGVVEYTANLKNPGKFIGKLTPTERVEYTKQGLKVLGDPVYFSLFYPRHFEQAELTMTYKWLDNEPKVLSAGMLSDNRLWQYYLQPLENTVLEKLWQQWSVVESGEDVYLLQRHKTFDSLQDFLQSQPDLSKLALFNLDAHELALDNYKLASNQSSLIQPSEFTTILRGYHQFFIYHLGGNLFVDLTLEDINENKDSDPVDLNLYFQDQLVLSNSLPDDGNSQNNGRITKDRDLSIAAADMPAGLYKIEVKTNDDILIRQMDLSSNYIAFVNGIRIAKTNQAITVYTNRNFVRATTVDPGSLQTVQFGQQEFSLNETYQQEYWSIDTNDKWSELNLPTGGVMLANGGLFIFNLKTAFDPQIRQLSAETNLDNIDYIIAKYQPIDLEDTWHQASATFDLYRAYSEDNKYSFILSVPSLSYQNGSGFIISELKVKLIGKSLWQKLKEKIL